MSLKKPDRFMRAAVVVLGLAWMGIGCGPSTLAFLFAPFIDDRVPPKCKLANPDKEITVVIASRFENLEVRPDVQPMASELAESLTTELRKRFKDNKENVKIIPPLRVQPHLGKIKDWSAAEVIAVGEKFKADYVISLKMQNVSLLMPNSYSSLYQGKADVEVSVFDTHQPVLEAEIHKGQFRCAFPNNQPMDASNVSPSEFRARFTNRMTRDLARWFTAYPPEEKVDFER